MAECSLILSLRWRNILPCSLTTSSAHMGLKQQHRYLSGLCFTSRYLETTAASLKQTTDSLAQQVSRGHACPALSLHSMTMETCAVGATCAGARAPRPAPASTSAAPAAASTPASPASAAAAWNAAAPVWAAGVASRLRPRA